MKRAGVAVGVWIVVWSLSLGGGAGAATAVAPAPGAPAAGAEPAGERVRPESLEQGFTLLVEDPSRRASTQSPIYLAANHYGWHAGAADLRLEQRSDGRWQITLPRAPEPGRMQFKFTRGSWETVEVAEDLSDIDNRVLPDVPAAFAEGGANAERPVIRLTISGWADQREGAAAGAKVDPYRRLEVTGQVRRLQVTGGGGAAAGSVRDVLVWLPPGYGADPGRAYPVLYLLDGQNVFEAAPGTPGEWGADETAQRLVSEGAVEPLVIVAVPHAGAARVSEYLPVPALEGVEPAAGAFLEFLAREVMPRVERAFRVRTDREGRGIGGSSLGGVFAVYAAAERPDLFGRLLVESPTPMGAAHDQWLRVLRGAKRWPGRVFIGVGGREQAVAEGAGAPRSVVAAAREIELVLRSSAGSPDVRFVVEPEAEHDEAAWAGRFPDALRHLYPAE